MADFLLELFCEEIPARMQRRAAEDLRQAFATALGNASIEAAKIQVLVTPRRLALIARGLPAAQPDVSEERRGPRADAPAPAVEGFLKSTGLTRDQLEERDDPKGRFLYAVIARAGRPTSAVIADIVPAIVRDFPWPKSMRWGERSRADGAMRWVRPLQSVIALLDGEVVALDVDGIPAGRTTYGHRFLADGPVEIASADDYAAKLRAAHVIVDPVERAAIIAAHARKLATAAGLELIEDEGLLAENAGLTEWPVPLLGDFDPAFLDVPPEVIQLTMRANQKYFACRDPKTGSLAPNFVCVANIVPSDGGSAIVAGNRKVLAARLSDAKFFWEQDRKRPLEAYLPKLDSMLFYEGLGTLRSKVSRIAELSAHIARNHFPDVDPQVAGRAGELSKADLASAMVGEFPELQGVMGGYYAEAGGEPSAIASAIRQQYLPAPEGSVAVCVALADRIDTLAAFFSRGIKPTGSKDPFALRRAALQIIQTIVQSGLRIPLTPLIAKADSGLAYTSDDSGWAGKADAAELLDFFADRLKVQQREAGVRHDLIDAVFALGGEDDLVRLLARVKALQEFIGTEDGANLLAGYKRAANILRIEEKKDGREYRADPDRVLMSIPQEIELARAVEAARAEAGLEVEQEDFADAMAALSRLRPAVDAFFNHVTVNDNDPEVRVNRLNLLNRIREAVHTVADFSRIEG